MHNKHNKVLAGVTLLLFISLAICIIVANVVKQKEIREIKENGICLDATVTKVLNIDNSEDTRYDVYYEYAYKEKTYEFLEKGSDEKYNIGETVKAYIYPDNPQELYFEEEPFSIGWVIFILAVGGVASLLIYKSKGKVVYDDHG